MCVEVTTEIGSIEWWKTLGEIIQSFLTAIAIVAAGAWTYMIFIRNRLVFPRLELSVLPHPVSISGGWIVHVAVGLFNSGSVVIRIREAELRLRTVIPLPDDVQKAVNDGFDPVPVGQTEVKWPMLAGREWKFDSKPVEIEPGENDTLHADFFIPENVKVVEFYAFVENAKKRSKGLGWSNTTIQGMYREEEGTMKSGAKNGRIDEQQQRQEKQQQQQPAQRPQQPRPAQDKSGHQDKSK